jgi:hypothetical protein
MRARGSVVLLVVAALVLALLPAGAGAVPARGVDPDLGDVAAPVARDLAPGDLVPADRNPDLPLRNPFAPPAVAFATPLADADSTEACDYDAYPEDPDDASIKLGLVPYHDIAPALCELETASDRVRVEVIGQSTQGRDLHLVTVTAPESAEEAAHQDGLRELITSDPRAAAARIDELAEDYKTPFFVNNNIHGNEWEGTDASLEVISDLAFTDDPAKLALLDDARLYFIPTANPDGRVAGTRANAAGFDMNRDFITQSQPEVRAMRDALVSTTPLIMLDIHGYTITTLLEPCTRPHNNNYEYDLYIKWALPQAEAMEAEIQRQTVLNAAPAALAAGVEIPYRDRDGGWDDWPPIFTPMYAMHQGAIGHTIEVPLPVNTLYSLPAPALQEMARENTVVARASIEGAFSFAHDNRAEMLRDQLEVFVRGVDGQDSPGNDGEGNAVWRAQEFPEAYVIPAGEGQHSASAAARLVDMLLANGVEVAWAQEAFTADGVEHPAGSAIVDMRQARRGMANVMLEAGTDISDDVPSMYDISGWSLGLLWGATVTAVAEPFEVSTAPLQPAPAGDPDVADPERAALTALGEVRLALAATAQERHALTEMGAEFVPVSTSTLNNGASLAEVDVLFVASGLSYSSLNDRGRAEVDAFLARGGGVVGRGAAGASFNDQAGLLDVSRASGPSSANGVVAVANDQGSPVTGSSPGEAHSFVYAPLWFTALGDGVRADQRLVEGNPLVAGHWRGSGGSAPEAAGGHALVVSGAGDSSARVVLFGSEPLFRAHPKGLYLQVAEALLWAAGD